MRQRRMERRALGSLPPFVVSPEIRALRFADLLALRQRSERDRHGLFLTEGLRPVYAAAEFGWPVVAFAVCPVVAPPSFLMELRRAADASGIPIVGLHLKEWRELSGLSGDSGVVAVLRQRVQPLPQDVAGRDSWMGVESVRHAGNLGTLLRSCAAFGFRGMIIFDRAAGDFGGEFRGPDVWDATVQRAAMGGSLMMSYHRVTHRVFRLWAKEMGVAVLGGDGSGAVDLGECRFAGPVVVMLGDERKGLSDGQRKSCDTLVRIPMVESVDSLNIGVAGSILAFAVSELKR